MNLKTKNNQNCQKIKLCGSLTTKELKKKHSFGPIGGVQTGSWDGKNAQQGDSWRTGAGKVLGGRSDSATQLLTDWWSHICVQINGKNSWGARQTAQPRFPAQENKVSVSLATKTCGGYSCGRSSQPQRRVFWRNPHGPKTYTNSPTWESAPEGPNLLVGSRESD